MNNENTLRLALPALLLLCPCAAGATEANDSVDSYSTQTVSQTVSVQGRTRLSSENVTVTPTGDLTLSAPQGVRITGPYKVQQGGRLRLNGGRQWQVRLTYDAAGNLTKKEKR